MTAGLPLASGLKGDDALQERRLRHDNVLDGLTSDRLGQEADEVAGVAGLKRHADLALGLEATDAGTVPRARIEDDEGPLLIVDLNALRRDDAGQEVVHRTR